VGTGPPPRPRHRHRDLGPALAAQPAALGDHPGPRRWLDSHDAGASLRDVQDYAGHKDPRTTRRYDHARDSLDRNAAYVVAAYLA
jgi:integrase